MATDYTDGLALKAMKNVFEYLPRAYNDGTDLEARQKMADDLGGVVLHHQGDHQGVGDAVGQVVERAQLGSGGIASGIC